MTPPIQTAEDVSSRQRQHSAVRLVGKTLTYIFTYSKFLYLLT